MPSKATPAKATPAASPAAPSTSTASAEASMGNAAAQADLDIAPAEKKAAASDEPRQSKDNLFLLYQDAAKAMVTLGENTQELAASTNGKPSIPSELKGFKRARAKIDADYGGDQARIVDLARSSVYYDDVSDMNKGVEEVKSGWSVVREKNRFETPAGGYRDMMFNVDIGGHICEIQLHLTKIIEAKAEGHGAYERISELKRKVEGGEGLSDEEDAELRGLKASQWKLYNDAYAAAGGDVSEAHRAKEAGA